MTRLSNRPRQWRARVSSWSILFLSSVFLSPLMLFTGTAHAAACTLPTTDYGTVDLSVNIPTAGTYRVWTRMAAPSPSSSASTYSLQIDSTSCYTIGGTNVPVYASGAATYFANDSTNWIATTTAGSYVDVSFTAGAHALKLIGNANGIVIDRLIATQDTTCVPTGTGDNCNVIADTTAPTTSITAPLASATVSGTATTISATATDNVGVTKVEAYVNSTLISTDTTAPYNFTWDTTKTPNGDQLLTVRAYDAAGNVGVSSIHVTVQNGDVTPPSTPSGLTATASAYNTVNLTWSGSTDNVGVTGYTVIRDGVPIATLGNVNSYTDSSLTANTTYTYTLQAFDAAGNTSASSAPVSVTTPNIADTQAPTTPTNLSASAASPSQINLAWTASTDNVGVSGYDLYRSGGASTSAQKIATVSSTSYGDTNLTANTTYTYYVVARDAAGNSSNQSASASATTLQPVTGYTVSGVVTAKNTSKGIPYATVSYTINGTTVTSQANSTGAYAFQNLNNGKYRFNYSAVGYSSTSANITISNANVVKNVTLR